MTPSSRRRTPIPQANLPGYSAQVRKVMGHIGRIDWNLHYSDHSHRWSPPDGVTHEAWDVTLQAHLAEHRSGAAEIVPRSCRDF